MDSTDGIVSVERVANEVLSSLAEPFPLENGVAYISVSIGITFYPQDATEVESLLKNADQAMYVAKEEGRNRFHFFTPAIQREALARMQMVSDLREALAEDQFRLVYQPILDLSSGAIHKAEALIRWQHPTKGAVGPAEFIPITEETGMIVDIGAWVFREAANQAAKWRSALNSDFQISINTSPVQFRDENSGLGEWVVHLKSLGLDGSAIVVEITEGLLMESGGVIPDKLLYYSEAGIQLALDDFGTGYSSLSYLKTFDIDYLKIDRSFVSNLTPGSDDLVLCEAIIVMAHKLGLAVIAEGIETEQQRDLLAAAGCDYGQGYLFAKPLPAAEFEKLFTSEKVQADG